MAVVLALLGCSAAPEGMVRVPAGSFVMGRDDAPRLDERPAHTVTLSAFDMDATLVTVAQFRVFVTDTGHRTTAEALGYGMASVEGMEDWAWERTKGADWRHPWGPERDIAQGDDHPVVQVSWVDADAYCRHRGQRLPTEAQWEYAMRAGAPGRYPWGDDLLRPDGSHGLNHWEGRDHHANPAKDGFVYTSPVRAYPPNAWGLYDPVGNVWQWTADWYAADTFTVDAAGVTDPTGPAKGWARVARGGSWWCSAMSCAGYGLWDRGKSHPEAPYPNNGFRCVSAPAR